MHSCDFGGCGRDSWAKGLCLPHYKQQWRGQKLRPLYTSFNNKTKGMSTAERIDYYTWIVEDGCHLWTGSVNSVGYGTVSQDGRPRVMVHRILSGAEANEVVDHKCGKRICVNPHHLRIVTKAENNQYRTVLQSTNTSGYRGVSRDPRNGTWYAQTWAFGIHYRAHGFATAEEANGWAAAKRAEVHPLGDFSPAP